MSVFEKDVTEDYIEFFISDLLKNFETFKMCCDAIMKIQEGESGFERINYDDLVLQAKTIKENIQEEIEMLKDLEKTRNLTRAEREVLLLAKEVRLSKSIKHVEGMI